MYEAESYNFYTRSKNSKLLIFIEDVRGIQPLNWIAPVILIRLLYNWEYKCM